MLKFVWSWVAECRTRAGRRDAVRPVPLLAAWCQRLRTLAAMSCGGFAPVLNSRPRSDTTFWSASALTPATPSKPVAVEVCTLIEVIPAFERCPGRFPTTKLGGAGAPVMVAVNWVICRRTRSEATAIGGPGLTGDVSL